MVLYYLTLSTDAILIIIQQRAALAFIVNDLLSTHLTVSSVSSDLDIGSCFLIEEINKFLNYLIQVY